MRWFIVLMVLWCGSASAAERWPAHICKEIAHFKQLYHEDMTDARQRAAAKAPLLGLLEKHCGVNVDAEFKADMRAFDGKGGGSKGDSRAPLTCATVGLGRGDAATTCF